MDHLRYSGKPDHEQRLALEQIVRSEPLLMQVLEQLAEINLPDWLLASGAIYNTVWNQLSGQPSMHGVKDIDVTYFDDSDLSYEAEDVVIQRLSKIFRDCEVPVEVRNQARVHLWFPQKFNQPFSALSSSVEMLGRYASKTHAVAVRLGENGSMSIFAPFGLDDMFSFRVTPNHVLENKIAHDTKGKRAKQNWPELTILPW